MTEDDAVNEERRERLEQRSLYCLSPSRITNTHFVQRYRITKDAFYFLCDTLRTHTDLRSSQRINLETKVLCALLFLPMTFIKFPNTREARDLVKQRFYNSYGIPGVVGCIDGCHFRIFKPRKEEEHLFYCRKHYHSLNVLMVCDDNCRIMYINPKFGGASHDAFVWENSHINNYLQTLHQSGESVWLLGDSGYPQRPWLMTPYSNPAAGSAAETYNNVHSIARVVIENTFGRLKNRWRCVCKDRVLHYKPEKCAQIIIACSVLHNLALDFTVPLPSNEMFGN
ncbi:hypothetical protein evm_014409 [Chilo suppressalis]|nr:hypothetical protein evm_014409 [Chilo suppressalis]